MFKIMGMKPSKCNYILQLEKSTLFFNGVTEAFFEVDNRFAESYKAIIEYPNDNVDAFPAFIKNIKSKGFVVEEDADELETVKRKYDGLRMRNHYFLMILPTYQCNLDCWYCTQEHEALFMSENVKDRVIRLIKNKLNDVNIKDLHISWFGGEPLMAYDRVYEISKFAKKYADDLGKQFSASITTNGTLLTPNRIESLRDVGIVNYQITIDGDRTIHNSVKNMGSISAYDRTLVNINQIAKHTHVNLRFNYCSGNLFPSRIIKSLLGVLNKSVLSNITFSIFKVWQETETRELSKGANQLFTSAIEAGMDCTLSSIGLCYAERFHYDCVFPNGKVGRCDNYPPSVMPGIIDEKGTIQWPESAQFFYASHLFDGHQKQCEECRFLPICWGPCVAKRETMLKEYGHIYCNYSSPSADMERLIINTCKSRTQKILK